MKDETFYITKLRELTSTLGDNPDNIDALIITATEFKQSIAEKDKIKQTIDAWYTKAENVSNIEELTDFVKWIFSQEADYELAVHAVSAIAIAATWCGENKYGLTGFQGSFVGLQYLLHWTYRYEDCIGIKVTDYTEMLYPQNRRHFEKTISSNMFSDLQKKAAKLLQKDGGAQTVREHWRSIVNGEVPFGYKIED